jgi:hypothetical protein
MLDQSPFPGMDPWLEPYWESVHSRIVMAMCDQISARLPSGLFADVEVTVYVLDSGEERGRPKPDVAVIRSGSTAAGSLHGATSAVASPYMITIAAEPVRQTHVVIRALADDEPLVTAIELISPTNKKKRLAREAYVAKRAAYYAAGANLLEVDLIRTGGHLIDLPMDDIPLELATAYKASVRRGRSPADRDDIEAAASQIRAEYYPLPLRQSLPRISLPLRPTDTDLILDLQEPLDTAYRGGRYGQRIDYSRPPDPPLSPEDAAWAAERIAAADVQG